MNVIARIRAIVRAYWLAWVLVIFTSVAAASYDMWVQALVFPGSVALIPAGLVIAVGRAEVRWDVALDHVVFSGEALSERPARRLYGAVVQGELTGHYAELRPEGDESWSLRLKSSSTLTIDETIIPSVGTNEIIELVHQRSLGLVADELAHDIARLYFRKGRRARATTVGELESFRWRD